MTVVFIEKDKDLRKVLNLTLGKSYKVLYTEEGCKMKMYHIKDDGGYVRIYNSNCFREER